jgi:hypothetical protein
MTSAARGVYITLLSTAWLEGGLDPSEETLRGLCGVPEGEWRSVWTQVRPCWDVGGDGRLYNPRLERERKKLKAAKRRQGGSREQEEGWVERVKVSPLGPSFVPIWEAWVKHRREIKKPMTPSCAVALIKTLAGMGAGRAAAAVEYTIRMGWQGLREEQQKGFKRGYARPAAAPKKETRIETLKRRIREIEAAGGIPVTYRQELDFLLSQRAPAGSMPSGADHAAIVQHRAS